MKAVETASLLIWRAFLVRSDTSATPSPLVETNHRGPEPDARGGLTEGERRPSMRTGLAQGPAGRSGQRLRSTEEEPHCPLQAVSGFQGGAWGLRV